MKPKMKIIVNTIAFIAFIAQFIPFAFSVLNQKEPECIRDSLYNVFIVIASFCSLFAVVFFVIHYNFDFKILKKTMLNSIILVIVLLGMYIHVIQLMTQTDYIPISCILIAFDCYCLRKVIYALLSPKRFLRQ